MAEWQDPKTFAIGLSIVMLVIIFLVASIVVLTRFYFRRIIQEQEQVTQLSMEHQQSLLWNSVLVQEKERERIASDLHDELISKLTVLSYAIQTGNSQIDSVATLNDTIRIAREITHDLSPPMLDQLSLPELIESFISPLSSAYTIDAFWGHCHPHVIKSEIKLQLLRIVQEVVNNILKHAKATRIDIRFRVTSININLLIRDNGIGFDSAYKEHGLGLKDIELRSQLLNGKWRFKSKPGKGTTFQFHLENDFILPSGY